MVAAAILTVVWEASETPVMALRDLGVVAVISMTECKGVEALAMVLGDLVVAAATPTEAAEAEAMVHGDSARAAALLMTVRKAEEAPATALGDSAVEAAIEFIMVSNQQICDV